MINRCLWLDSEPFSDIRGLRGLVKRMDPEPNLIEPLIIIRFLSFYFFQCKKIKRTVCGPEDCPVRLLPENCRTEIKKVRHNYMIMLSLSNNCSNKLNSHVIIISPQRKKFNSNSPLQIIVDRKKLFVYKLVRYYFFQN